MGDLTAELVTMTKIGTLLELHAPAERERMLWHLLEVNGPTAARTVAPPPLPAPAAPTGPRRSAGQMSRVGRGDPMPVPRPRHKVSSGPLKSKGPAVTRTVEFVDGRAAQGLETTQHDVAARFGLSISGADQRLAQAVQDGLIEKLRPGVYGPKKSSGAQANAPAA